MLQIGHGGHGQNLQTVDEAEEPGEVPGCIRTVDNRRTQDHALHPLVRGRLQHRPLSH